MTLTRRMITALSGTAMMAGLIAPDAARATEGGARVTDDPNLALAGLQAGRVEDLQRYAKAAGILLGSDNDQPAFDAAERAMSEAALDNRSLYVRVPPGHYRLRRIRLHNRGGYYANPKTVILEQLAPQPGAPPEAFVALADPFASFFLFYGFTLRGGWRRGRPGYGGGPGEMASEADPWLYQPERTSAPGAKEQLGQTAIQLHSAYSGVDDGRFMRNSPIDAQNPRGRIAELEIEGFGGDGLSIKGAGCQIYSSIEIFRVGGRGVVLDGYDCNLTALDIGETGLEGFVIGPNGSSCRITPFKVWYSGGRRLSGHTAALRLDRCSGVQMVGELQDASGGMVEADDCRGCTAILSVGWQGEIKPMDADIAALTWRGNVRANTFVVNAEVGPYAIQPFPTVKRLLRTTANASGVRPRRNSLFLNHDGWPNDSDQWNEDWFDGPLDGNLILVNDQVRQPGHWTPGDDGALVFGIRQNPTGVATGGLTVEAAVQGRPGVSRWVHSTEARIEHWAPGKTTTLLSATLGLVSLGAPLRLVNFTVATAPSAVAAGAGAAIYLIDEVGGPQGAKSDGRVWRRDSDNAIAKA